MIRINFEDEHGNYIVMECSSVVAMQDPDKDGWLLLATEVGQQNGTIIGENLSESDAKAAVDKLAGISMGVMV